MAKSNGQDTCEKMHHITYIQEVLGKEQYHSNKNGREAEERECSCLPSGGVKASRRAIW